MTNDTNRKLMNLMNEAAEKAARLTDRTIATADVDVRFCYSDARWHCCVARWCGSSADDAIGAAMGLIARLNDAIEFVERRAARNSG